MTRVEIEKKIKNIEHNIMYLEKVYKKGKEIDGLKEMLEYYRILLKNTKE